MADSKISALTALTGANVANDDLIHIIDTSATENKKITISEFLILAAKQYSGDGTDFTVSGTNWTTVAAKASYHQNISGQHFINGYIVGTLSSTTTVSLALTMSGITTGSYYQTFSAILGNGGYGGVISDRKQIANGSAIFTLRPYLGAAINYIIIQFNKLELASKPVWAD